MCLRLNKDAKSDGRVKAWRKVAQMREPAGYLGAIVRRMKYRAAVQCDGVMWALPEEVIGSEAAVSG
jgi:hypothetical protein